MESPMDPEATFENFIIEKRANQDDYHFYIYSYKTLILNDGTDYHLLMNTKEMIDMDGANPLNSKLGWFGQCLYKIDELTGLAGEVIWCTGGSSTGGGIDNGDGGTSSSNRDITFGEWLFTQDGTGTCTKSRVINVTEGSLYNEYMTSNYNGNGSFSSYSITQSFYKVPCNSSGDDTASGNGDDPHFSDDSPISNHSGSGSLPSGPNPGDIGMVVTAPVIPYDVQIMECLGDNILATGNTSIPDWLDMAMATDINGSYVNYDAYRNAKDLSNYLKDNCNAESEAFALLAIEAFDSDGEVDFKNKIIKTPSFIGTKADCVYELLGSTNNNLFKDVLSTFTDGKAEFKLKFRIGDVPHGADGSTTFDEKTGVITITFPSEIIIQSSLEIAATILHEGIHAELRRIYHGNNDVAEPLPDDQYEYLASLWDYYRGVSPASKVSNNASHTFMVHNHVLPLAKAIKEFDNNSYSIDNYMWFGWDGLSDIGKITIPQLLTSSEEKNYIDLQQIPLTDIIKQSCDE